MCDTNKIAGLLAGAKIAYIAVLTMLGIAILNSASFFAAAANIPLMVAVIASNALAITLNSLALVELDKCAGGPCGRDFDHLRTVLIVLIATLSGFTLLLIALAVVAAVPFAGAVAAGTTLATIIALTGGALGTIEFYFINAVRNFNNCRLPLGLPLLVDAVIVLAGVAIVASFLFGITIISKPG